MLSKNLILTTLLLAIVYAPAAFSQAPPTQEYEPSDSQLSIQENNLYCFQTLQCLRAENPFNNSSIADIMLNDTQEKYVIEGKSRNEELYAEYNGKNGTLIKATVIQRNIILPKHLLVTLTSGEFKSWTMVGNKRTIKNFSKDSIEYEVVLMKDGELRIEYFDSNGMVIDQLI